MPHATTHRVLFIDAYDSFTNNIIALLETNLRVEVTTIKIDEEISDFAAFLESFSAVIAGPGPGDPRNCKDVGWIRELWKLEGQDVLPVLGICLGFQSLVLAFGGTIDRLREPRHGIVRKVRGSGEGIFRGIEEVETVQYHSLCASIGPEGKHERTESCDASKKPLLKCLDLRPLAWDYEMDNTGDRTDESFSVNPPRVLVAVEHKTKPFFGLQFHAESICSNSNARKVIEAWWGLARKWRRPSRYVGPLSSLPRSFSADLRDVQVGSGDENMLPKYQRAIEDSKTSSIASNGTSDGVEPDQVPVEALKGCNGVYHLRRHGRRCTVQVLTSLIDV